MGMGVLGGGWSELLSDPRAGRGGVSNFKVGAES